MNWHWKQEELKEKAIIRAHAGVHLPVTAKRRLKSAGRDVRWMRMSAPEYRLVTTVNPAATKQALLLENNVGRRLKAKDLSTG